MQNPAAMNDLLKLDGVALLKASLRGILKTMTLAGKTEASLEGKLPQTKREILTQELNETGFGQHASVLVQCV